MVIKNVHLDTSTQNLNVEIVHGTTEDFADMVSHCLISCFSGAQSSIQDGLKWNLVGLCTFRLEAETNKYFVLPRMGMQCMWFARPIYNKKTERFNSYLLLFIS